MYVFVFIFKKYNVKIFIVVSVLEMIRVFFLCNKRSDCQIIIPNTSPPTNPMKNRQLFDMKSLICKVKGKQYHQAVPKKKS